MRTGKREMSEGWEKAVIKQVEDKVKEETLKLAKKAQDELVKEYKHVVNMFYSEYSPKSYKRHASRGMTPGYELSYKKFWQNSHGALGVVYGGVEISPDRMYSDYRESSSAVLQSFLDGYHGPPNAGIWSSVDAYNHMIKFRDILANNLV